MPPKKKPRTTPAASTPSASSPPSNAVPASLSAAGSQKQLPPSPVPDPSAQSSMAIDLWTSTQETALFKLLIHHKPTGLHKHLHMLSIYYSLRSQGHIRLRSASTSGKGSGSAIYTSTPHLRIPALWDKLRQLYDLEALDEREDSWRFANLRYDEEGELADPLSNSSSSEEGRDGSKGGSGFWDREFALDGHRKIQHGKSALIGFFNGAYPEGVDVEEAVDFAMRIFERRLKPDGQKSESPPSPAKTGDNDSSPAGAAIGKRKRGTTTSLKKQSQNHLQAPAGGRRPSKATATTASSDAGGTSNKDDEDEEDEQDSTGPARRTTRGKVTKGKKAKGKAGKKG